MQDVKRKNKRTKLSIITVCYNDATGLERTLRSVAQQSNQDYELIVIDGGSSDSSPSIISSFQPIISYSISEADRGIYHAMNKGITQATGEYCFFLNAGDLFYDSKVIQRFYNCQSSADIITGHIVFNLNGVNKKVTYAPKEANTMFFMTSTLAHQATFIRTSLLKELPYEEEYRICADFVFFFRSIILNHASYERIDQYISNSDLSGVSNEQLNKVWKEKDTFFRTILPQPITEELKTYSYLYNIYNCSPSCDIIKRICLTTIRFIHKIQLISNRIYNKLDSKLSKTIHS